MALQVVVMVAPVCVTQQTIKLLRFNFNFRHLYYVRTIIRAFLHVSLASSECFVISLLNWLLKSWIM
jgi:hypothetical protein